MTEDRSDLSAGTSQFERHWIAVRGERIVSKADTEERAGTAADHLGERYDVVVAVPKGGVPSGPF